MDSRRFVFDEAPTTNSINGEDDASVKDFCDPAILIPSIETGLERVLQDAKTGVEILKVQLQKMKQNHTNELLEKQNAHQEHINFMESEKDALQKAFGAATLENQRLEDKMEKLEWRVRRGDFW